MANKEERSEYRDTQSKSSRQLMKKPHDNMQDYLQDRVDSGIGESLKSMPTDGSSADSFSVDDQARDQECGATAEVLEKTANLNINEAADEGYVSKSLSIELSNESLPSSESTDRRIPNYRMPYPNVPNASIYWYMSCFARTQDLRFMLAALWPALLHQNDDGDTSLHLAIINCHEALILAILDVLPRPEYFDIYNHLSQTALHLAVITRQHKIIQKLIDHGASVELVDRNGQTCVHLACERGDLKALRAIFKPRPGKVELQERLQELLEIKNFNGLTPLCVAVQANHVEIVKELIRLGADVNSIDSKSGNTALHLAVENNNLPMVSCLLFQGNANPNAESYSHSTPLHIAAGLGLEVIVATLIAVGASTSIENIEGDTAFKMASESFEDFLEDGIGLEEMEN